MIDVIDRATAAYVKGRRFASFMGLVWFLGCSPGVPPQRRPPDPTPSSTAPAPIPSAVATTTAATNTAQEPWNPDTWTGASPTVRRAPVVVKGSVDGAALRKRHLARMKEDHWPVVVVQGADAYSLGKKLCQAVVPKRPADTPVLIKPNICGFHAIKKVGQPGDDDGIAGRITDPAFTRGVIHCLRERGHTAITLAEGCAVPHGSFQKVIALSGYAALAKEEKVPLVGMDDDTVFDAVGDKPGRPLRVTGMEETEVPTLLLPKVLVEHLERGLFLSLPKMKAHRYSVVSAGIKGTQGVVMRSDAFPAHMQKWRMHRELHRYLRLQKEGHEDRDAYVEGLEKFSRRVLDVMEVAMPDAILVEGAPRMMGDGFDLLLPEENLVAVGGSHPVRVDRVVSRLLGLWEHPTLKRELGGYGGSPLIILAARRWNVGPDDDVVGDGAALLKQPVKTRFRALAPIEIGPTD